MKETWHWQCNGKLFDNKILAISEQHSSKYALTFHTPSSYQDCDFSKEPNQDLQTLLKDYALKIRQEYPYVRFWFSGGCDSEAALRVFLDNNIHIDEIIVVGTGIPDYDYEINDVAIPYLKRISPTIPKTKITIRTPSIQDYNLFFRRNYWYENLTTSNGTGIHFQPTQFMRDYSLFNDETMANIYGISKPIIIYHMGEWWVQFYDSAIEPYQKHWGHKINFFADDPEIHIKQCHMLRRNIIKNCSPSEYNSVCHKRSLRYQQILNWGVGRLEHKDSFFIPKTHITAENIKLDNGETIWFSSRKEQGAIEGMLKINPEVVKKWHKTILEFSNFADGTFFHDGRADKDFISVLSPFYSLDTGTIKTVDDLFPNGYNI